MNAAVSAHRERDAERINRLRVTDRHGNHFVRLAGFLQLHGRLNRDFIKGVHRTLDHGLLINIKPAAVRQSVDLHVVVNNSLYCDQHLHYEKTPCAFRALRGVPREAPSV